MIHIIYLITISLSLLVGLSSCYAQTQTADNITIRATLKDNYLQNITMLADNKDQCPEGDCEGRLEGTTFDGSALDKSISGTVKVKDRANSDQISPHLFIIN